MEQATILHSLNPEQINILFQDLHKQLNEIKKNFEPKSPVELLTRADLAKLLKCDLSTIHNWTKKGILKAYGIGNRVYYKRNEVEAVLLSLGQTK